jgi:Ca2+-binding RTX toxin-like protein
VHLDGGDGSDTLAILQQGTALTAVNLADFNQTDAAQALVFNFGNVDASMSGSEYSGLALLGSDASNILIGTGKADTIDGAGGSDTLTGGGGDDTFLFDTALGSGNVDTITDFTLGSDLVALDKSIFTALGADGTLADSAFGLGTTAATADQRILYDSASGDLYYDKDGSGSATAVKFAIIASGLALTASSFKVQG